MNKAIRNLGLVGLVLGATAFSGCSNQFIKGKEFPPPRLTNGPYKGMNYILLNEYIAKEEGEDVYIEIKDPNYGRKIKVTYNSNGSVKNITGDLPYHEEEVRKIIKQDTFFKSTIYINRK